MTGLDKISIESSTLKSFFVLWLFVSTLNWTGCGQVQPETITHMFFGTVTSTSIDASGSWAFLRLMEQGASLDDTPLYIASCQLTGPACDFQINEVAESRYTVFGIIDRNHDADRTNPLPNSGDLLSPGRPLILLSRQQMDFPDEAWRLLP